MLFILSLPSILNVLLDHSQLKTNILQTVYKKTNIKLDPETIKFSLIPSPSIEFEHFTLDLQERVSIDIELLRLCISIKSLVFGNIVFNDISVHNPLLNTLSNIDNNKTQKNPDLKVENLESLANLIMSSLPDNQEILKVDIKNLKYKYLTNFDSTLFIDKKEEHIKLISSINQFSLSNEQIKKLKSLNLSGIYSCRADKVQTSLVLSKGGYLSCSMNVEKAVILSSKDNIIVNAPLISSNYSLQNGHHKGVLKPCELIYPQAVIEALFDYNEMQNQSLIRFIGNNLNVEQVSKSTRSLLPDHSTVSTIFAILLRGLVPNIQLTFTGTNLHDLFDENQLVLDGVLTNGDIHIPETKLITSATTGNVNLKNGVLGIDIERGKLDSSIIKSGNLAIDLLNYENIPFEGDFNIDLDLTSLPSILISLMPETILAEELKKVSNIKGRVDTKLGLYFGSSANDIEVSVKTGPFKISGNYQRIPGDITLDSIKFNMHDDVIHLSDISGSINKNIIHDMKVSINSEKNFQLDIKNGSGILDLEKSISWLNAHEETSQLIHPVKTGSGQLSFQQLSLSGPAFQPETWTYSAIGSGSNMSLSSSSGDHQLIDIATKFELNETSITLKETMFDTSDLSWLNTFIEKKYLDSVKTPVSCRNGTLVSSPKRKIIKSDLLFQSGANLHLDLAGKKFSDLDILSLNLKTDKYTDATIKALNIKKRRVYEFKGKLSSSAMDKMLNRGSHFYKRINRYKGRHPIYIYSTQDKTINILSRYLNLTPLLNEKTNKNSSEFHTRIYQKINLKTEKLKIRNYNFTNIDSNINFKKNLTYIKINKANLCDLKTSGYLKLKNNKIYADLPFQAINQSDINKLLVCLFDKNKFVDGPYSLKLNLKTASPKKKFINKINGSMDLSAKEGRIYKMTLLSRILSVLNLSKLFQGKVPDFSKQGFAYESLEFQAKIKNSRLHLTKGIIDGEDMALLFSGYIDPLADELELTCLVAPFKTIDVIIKHIPIINTILGGRLVTVPVQATGTLSDPQVIPLHPSAVGKGLIDLMTGILKAPINILDDLTSDEE